MDQVWVDGHLVRAGEAVVDATSPGVLTGTGAFESMKVLRGEAFALRRHLARLRQSAATVGVVVPCDDRELRRATQALLAASPSCTKVRITVLAGPPTGGVAQVVVSGEVTDPWPPTARVVWSPWVRNERSPSTGAKTTSYVDNVLARRDALVRGADEALLTDTRGNVSEGTASNVFAVVDGRLCTPSLRTGCLAGMTRELLIEQVDVDERDDLSRADLDRATEVFLTSSTRDVHPVADLDGRVLDLAPGPVTLAATAALHELEARTTDP